MEAWRERKKFPLMQLCNDAERGLTRIIGFSFLAVSPQMSPTAQNQSVFVFVFSHLWFYVCRWIWYPYICVCRTLCFLTYNRQRLPISPGAASEMTAQRASCRMTQTHTARQPAWLTRGELGLCDGGERRAAWGQVKWSQRHWLSSGG